MTSHELIRLVRTRGGQLRAMGARLQFRPSGILTPDELDWLGRHRSEVIWALERSLEWGQLWTAPSAEALSGLARQPLGHAGPGVEAWHCRIDLGSGHIPGTRADGSRFCATCHPPTISHPRRLQ